MTMKKLSVSHLKRRVACSLVVAIAVFLGPTTMAQQAAVEDVIEAFYEAAGNGTWMPRRVSHMWTPSSSGRATTS